MNKLLSHGKSVILAWILSYMLIIVLAVLGNLFTTNRFANSFKEQIFKDTAEALYHASANADDRMRDIKKTAHLIGANSNLNRLLSDNNGSTTAIDYNSFITELRSYQVANSFIKYIYVFPDNTDNVISTTFVRDSAYREQLLSQYSLADGEDISDVIRAPHYGDFLSMIEYERPSSSSSVVTYLQSLPANTTKRVDGTLMLVMDSSSLLASLSADIWYDGSHIIVMDSGNNIIAANSAVDLDGVVSYDMLEGSPDRFDIKLNGEEHTVLQATSEVNTWKYIVILPTEVMIQDVRNVQRFFLESLIITLALGFVASIFLARRNYLPLKILMKSVESDAGIAFGGGVNEFQYLQTAVTSALAEKEAQKSAYKNQLIRLRSGYFAGIMKNELDAELTMDDMLKACDINFRFEKFALLLISIKGVYGKPPGSRRDPREKESKSIVASVFEEFINKNHDGFVINVDEMQVAVWNFPNNATNREIRDDILHVTEECLEFLQNTCDTTVTVTASSPFLSLTDLSGAYKEVFTGMEYCVIMGLIGLHFSEDIRYGQLNTETYHYYYPLQLEIQMTNLIKCGDYAGAKHILDEFFRVNFEELSLPQPIMKCFMFNLTSTMLKTVYELDIMEEESEISNSIDLMLSCHSVTEIYEEAKHVMAALCNHKGQGCSSHSFLSETQIFVQKHYSDVNLSITMIAGHFNLTPSYLSKKFKSLTGGGLPEYINQVRLDKAKSMLIHTKCGVGAIATACGFINSNTFIRVFKKFEGITPRTYRDTGTAEHLHD